MSEAERRAARQQADGLVRSAKRPRVQQQQRPEPGGASGSSSIACILRSVDFAETITDGSTSSANPDYGKMVIQRVVYSDNPPVMGNIVVQGPLLDAYPFEGSDPEGYDVGLYPEQDDEGNDIAFPPANADWVYCRRATQRGGVWLVENPLTMEAGIKSLSISATQAAAGSV